MLKKQLEELNTRKIEIRNISENPDTKMEVLDELIVELDGLKVKETEIRSKMDKIEKLSKVETIVVPESANVVEIKNIVKPKEEVKMEKNTEQEIIEKRGKDLKENRSVTIASSNIVMAANKSSTINPTFNEVSSLVDRVAIQTLIGGESYEQPYQTGWGTGDVTAEGDPYTTADPTFGKVTIGKAKVTSYSEEAEEVMKLGIADYDSVIVNGMSVAIKKKLGKEILVGTGASNHMAGIFTVAATPIDIATDLEMTDIDETTLDEIIYAFGGDEDVEAQSVLILNKKDLGTFAKLRTDDGAKVYTIVNKGNTGTIDGVPYIINSACKALSDAATTTGQYAMAYGPLSNYKMTIFSNLEVQRSNDFKFSTGMICHKGVIFAGGNVVSKNGFLRVKHT